MALEDKVRDIIVENLGVNAEQVTAEASFVEDLGADSLDTVELVMAFEEEFGAEIPDEDAEKLTTVGAVMNYLKEKVWANNPTSHQGRKGVLPFPAFFNMDGCYAESSCHWPRRSQSVRQSVGCVLEAQPERRLRYPPGAAV